jgi:YggT family protein
MRLCGAWEEAGGIMHALFWLIDTALSLFVWALIIGAVVSLLIAFNVLDTRNRAVWAIADFFHRLTEPALRPIRRFIPNLGGIDISPVVLILLLQAARILLAEIQYGLLGSGFGR